MFRTKFRGVEGYQDFVRGEHSDHEQGIIIGDSEAEQNTDGQN